MRLNLLSIALLVALRASAQTLAPTPPMGWNSWDSYGTTLTGAEYKANVDAMASALKPFGYQYAVIDIEWYTPHPPAHGSYIPDPTNVTLDAYGRFIPAPNRFPSAANGAGFRALAGYAHAHGLKFGIHIMRGVPREAVARNLPIEGTPYHAAEIADQTNVAHWTGMADTYGIDMAKPGAQAYYDSIVRLYASWGVDYIKADDMTAPFHAAEIEGLALAIRHSGRAIVLSLSPGPAPLAEHALLARDAQLWRISGDFWDRWHDIEQHFALMQAWQPFVGGGHWPDPDMLPLGHIALRGENGSERQSRLTHAEQRTLINLWSIFRGPLIMGGDLPSLLTEPDRWTLSLLTNPRVLAVDQHSHANRCVKLNEYETIWTAQPDADSKVPPGSYYVAIFNRSETMTRSYAAWPELSLPPGIRDTQDLWSGQRTLGQDELSIELAPHESALLLVSPTKGGKGAPCWQNLGCSKPAR